MFSKEFWTGAAGIFPPYIKANDCFYRHNNNKAAQVGKIAEVQFSHVHKKALKRKKHNLKMLKKELPLPPRVG
jgi:hypothetical protein